MERDEAGTFARIKALRTGPIEPILARHGGRFVDLKGDGAIVELGSALGVVEAAAAVQCAMLEQDRDLPEEQRIRYRVDINLGDVIVDGRTIDGDGVNVAARIESLCEPGGMWVARSVRNQVKGKLDLASAPTGLHQVKNRREPVDVRQVGREPDVDYVLEGSIQRQADRVRATAQLIDATSDAHGWSERWDRPTQDVIAVQSEAANAVASRLGGYGEIAGAEHAAAVKS